MQFMSVCCLSCKTNTSFGTSQPCFKDGYNYKYSSLTYFMKYNEIQTWPKYFIWYIHHRKMPTVALPCHLPVIGLRGWGRKRGDSKRVKDRALREMREKLSRGQDSEKKCKVNEASCVFQLLIGPIGRAGGYHREIFHLSLCYSYDQMSRGWHKQKYWSRFGLGFNPSHAPPPSWIIPFLISLSLLSICSRIYNSSAVFLISLTQGRLHKAVSVSNSIPHLHLPISHSSCFCPSSVYQPYW